MTERGPQTTYVLRLTPTPRCADEIKSLRWVLKTLLRRCELRCISIKAEPSTQKETDNETENR